MAVFLARGDYSQIEARVNPWLAGAEWKLDAFRRYDAGTGPDLYKVGAGGIYGVPAEDVSKPQRQIGKVSELALGFQGATGALQAMSRGYGIKIPHWQAPPRPRGQRWEDRARPPTGTDQWIVDNWRAANPEIVQFWRDLETAAADCAGGPVGNEYFAGPRQIRFKRNRKVMSMRLPSGGCLFYWSPRLSKVTTAWGAEKWAVIYRSEDSVTRQWSEFAGYGGLWCENAVQGTARDIMADAARRLDPETLREVWDDGLRDLTADETPGLHARARKAWAEHRRQLEAAEGIGPVLLVHDEAIAEVEADTADEAAERVRRIMVDVPAWCEGLPVAADASAGPRYVKG
jgi:DNA polymerase